MTTRKQESQDKDSISPEETYTPEAKYKRMVGQAMIERARQERAARRAMERRRLPFGYYFDEERY